MNIILYLLQLIQYQQKQIFWLLNFSIDISHSNSGLSMIPIRQNIKNFGLTSFQRLSIIRNGITKNTSLIWNGGMVKRLNRFNAGANAILTTIVLVPAVMRQNHISIGIMVPKDSFSAKYVPLPFHQKKTVFPNRIL